MCELHPNEISQLREMIRQEAVCIQKTREDIEKISQALFDEEDGIVSWAKDHIESEKERREIMREIKKKLAVRGALGAATILCYLLWVGFKSYVATGVKP